MLEVRIEGAKSAFAPRQPVRGQVEWHEDAPPEAIEVRLLWHTSGRGDTDVGVARTTRIEAPSATGSSRFEFECPHGPYSFSGRLISLRWAVEATAVPQKTTARAEIVVAPGGEEVDLTRLAG
jgi:hypothetical protein